MDRTVGKYLCTLLCLLITHTNQTFAGVSLKVRDTNNKAIEQVAAGQPFQIEVIITDLHGSPSIPILKHDSHVQSQRTGKRTSIINGRSTHTFTYHAQADEPGTYRVGPATVSIGSTHYTADPITVTIGNRTVTTKKQAGYGDVTLYLVTDKKEAVVGEKITCALRLYADDTSIGVSQAIGQPKLKDFTVSEVGSPRARQDERGERCIEWRWTVYPRVSGQYTIPAHSIDYEAPVYHEDFWWGVRSILGPRMERKRAYSNSTQLTIDPLPTEARDVQAVGSFDKLVATITPAVAKRGEGMVLSIEISGDEGFDQIDQFPLIGIPDDLRCYESNKSTHYTSGDCNAGSRTFEYVVQGLEPGNWTIPEQTLTYFDTQTYHRKQLHTTPLSVTVIPGNAPPHATSSPHKSEPSDTSAGSENDKPFCDIDEEGPWHRSQPIQVPWLLFFVLLILPLGWLAYVVVNNTWRNYYRRNEKAIRARRAFTTARARLRQGSPLVTTYQILRQCIAERIGVKEQTLTHDRIEQLLMKAELPDDQILSWHEFFHQCAQQAFGSPSETEAMRLRQQAQEWLDRLQKVL